MTFGEKIKSLREQNGITQEELAQKLYVTRTAVSKWENDKGFPSIDTLKHLAELFGVTLDELVSDDAVKTARLAEDRAARRFRIPAICCLAAAFTLAFLTAYARVVSYAAPCSPALPTNAAPRAKTPPPTSSPAWPSPPSSSSPPPPSSSNSSSG